MKKLKAEVKKAKAAAKRQGTYLQSAEAEVLHRRVNLPLPTRAEIEKAWRRLRNADAQLPTTGPPAAGLPAIDPPAVEPPEPAQCFGIPKPYIIHVVCATEKIVIVQNHQTTICLHAHTSP